MSHLWMLRHVTYYYDCSTILICFTSLWEQRPLVHFPSGRRADRRDGLFRIQSGSREPSRFFKLYSLHSHISRTRSCCYYDFDFAFISLSFFIPSVLSLIQ